MSSQTTHPRTHVFLKLKTPVRIQANRPLLESILYQPSQTGPELVGEKAPRSGDFQKGGEHRRHHHHHHSPKPHHQQKSDPMTGGYVSRSREELRQEVKQRRKLEKKRASPPEERSKVEGTCGKEKEQKQNGGHGR